MPDESLAALGRGGSLNIVQVGVFGFSSIV